MPNLNDARPDRGHRSPIVRLEAELNQVQLMAGVTTRTGRKIAQIILRATDPTEVFVAQRDG